MGDNLLDGPLEVEQKINNSWRFIGLARILFYGFIGYSFFKTYGVIISLLDTNAADAGTFLGTLIGVIWTAWWTIFSLRLAIREITLSPKILTYKKSRWISLFILLFFGGQNLLNSLTFYSRYGFSVPVFSFLALLALVAILLIADLGFIIFQKSAKKEEDV